MSRYLLPLSEYNRIYQVAHGVLRDVANVERACIFFAAFGSYILNKHYKIAARPVAGAFALCVSDAPSVAFFGKKDDHALLSDSGAFHMWIQTKTHIIDFMAPIFPEAFAEHDLQTQIPRRMLQKSLMEEVSSANDLQIPGDFFTLPNSALTEKLLDNFLERKDSADLIAVGEKWFGNRTKKQAASMSMINDLGTIYPLHLSKHFASSSW